MKTAIRNLSYSLFPAAIIIAMVAAMIHSSHLYVNILQTIPQQ